MKSGKERSQKRFEKNVKKAVDAREELLQKNKLSVARGAGKLVIVVAGRADWNSGVSEEDQKKAFHEEADMLAEKSQPMHEKVEVVRKSNSLDLEMHLRDKEVSDLVLIGHGSIGDFWTDDGGHFGWKDFSNNMNHLKQGNIVQRVCGHYALSTSVALGTFNVSDQRNVIAPVGKMIPDINPDESLFVPVYEKAHNTVEDILELTRKYHIPSSDEKTTE